MSIVFYRRILLLLLLTFLARACLDPAQTQGSCSKCLSTQNLQAGFCYAKLRGCFRQSANTCLQCQSGFVLATTTCIRSAEFFNNTNLAPAPITIQQQKLNASQINSVLIGAFRQTTNFNTPTFLQAKSILEKQYPFLSGFKLYKVEQQIVNGVNYLFYIIDLSNYDLYLARVYVSFKLEGSVTELYKNDQNIMKTPIPIQSGQLLPGTWRLFTNISDQRYVDSLELLNKAYPGIETYRLDRVQSQIVAGINFLFYYTSPQEDNFTVQVYTPFYGLAVVTNFWGSKPQANTIPSQPQPIAGGSQTMPVQQLERQPFLAVVKTIQKVFPSFQVKHIKTVERQIVAGWNLVVSFQLPGQYDLYDVQVFVSLAYTQNLPIINQIKKNGVSLTPESQHLPVSNNNQAEPEEPKKISPQVGGYRDVINLDSPFYLQAKKNLFKQHPELQKVTLIRSQEQIVNGVNYKFQFTDGLTQDIYTAQVYVSLSLEVSVNEVLKNGQSIMKSQESNESDEITRVESPSLSQTSPISQPIITGGYSSQVDFTSLLFIEANQTLYNEYGFLNGFEVKNIQQQVVSGKNYLFTLNDPKTKDEYSARVYVNLKRQAFVEEISKNGVSIKKDHTINQLPTSTQLPTTIPKTQNSSVDQLLAGGWQMVPVSDYDSEMFKAVQSTILRSIPSFTSGSIVKVARQLVAGWNYIVQFVAPVSSDVYEVKVFVPLPHTQQPPSITQAKKNGVTLDLSSTSLSTRINPPYSYLADPTFTELYKFFKTQVKISNLLPIAQVTRELKQLKDSQISYFEYRIMYSTDEYAICRYYPDFGVYEVVSYMADGTELYNLAYRINAPASTRTENILVETVKQYDPKRFNRILVQEITQIVLSQHYRVYQMVAITSAGRFNITLLDRGKLFVVQVKAIDDSTCFTIRTNAAVQSRQQYIIDQIRTFLFSKYALDGYELTLAAVNALTPTINQYLILLARNDLRKLRVSVEETNGTFAIKKQQLLNNGLFVVSDIALQTAGEEAAQKEFSQSLTGFDRILVLTNGTHNVAKYANDTTLSTYRQNTQSNLTQISYQQFAQFNSCQVSLQNGKCNKCALNDILWRGRCFLRVQNCAFQVGSQCLACDKFSIQVNGKCIRSCSELFL